MAKIKVLTEAEARERSITAFQNSSFSDLPTFVEYGRNYLLNDEDAALFDEYCDMMWLVEGINVRKC